MKTNLFPIAIAALAVITGCAKNDVYDSTVTGELDKMEFTPVVGKQTRANEIISADLQKNGTVLNLYGYKTAAKFDSRASLTPFFDNTPEALTFSGYWSTAKDYAWTDLATGYLSIFTYFSPKNVLTGITAPTSSVPAKFTYTIPNTIADQEDLLVATQLDMTKANTGGLIAINFKHALSQLYFKAKLIGTGYKAVIRSIKVVGATNSNTFTYNVSGTGVGAGSWGATPSGAVNYTFAEGISQNITSKDIADRIATQNGSLMLMPQNANNGTFKFEVTYDVFDSNGAVIGARIVKTADMAALEMGKKYAYTLILPAAENDNIAFDVTVSDWDDTSVNSQREIRFDEYKMNGTSDQASITDLITGYTPSVVYLHELKITADDLAAPLSINLSSLSATAVSGSKIILDFTILDWNSNDITVTVPTGWTLANNPLAANGKITITKD